MCLFNIVLPIIIDIEIHNAYFRALYCLAVMRLNSWHMCVCGTQYSRHWKDHVWAISGYCVARQSCDWTLSHRGADWSHHSHQLHRTKRLVSECAYGCVCVKREFGQWVCVCACLCMQAWICLCMFYVCIMDVKRLLSKRETESVCVCTDMCVCVYVCAVRCVVGWLVCVYLFDMTLVIFLPHQMDFHTEKNSFVFPFDLVASKNSVVVSVICWSKIYNRNGS